MISYIHRALGFDRSGIDPGMATRARAKTSPAPELVLPAPRAKGLGLVRMSSGDQAALYIRRLMFDGDLRPGTGCRKTRSRRRWASAASPSVRP